MMNSKHRFALLASLSFGLLIVLWAGVTYSRLIAPFFLPTPTEVLNAGIDLFQDHNFAWDIGISVVRILAGFIIASLLAIPIGILIGMNRNAEAFVEPVVDFIRYTPIPAFIPLFILWFGIGETEKVVVIASSVFFQLVLMVANSVSAVPRAFIESARTLGATKLQVVKRVVFPFAKPRIVDDLRVSMGWAWAGLMMAEIVGSTSGIGFVIIQSQRLLQTANVIAAIVIVGVLGLATDLLFKKFHRMWFPWAPKISHYT